jgi:hypothetical protein
MKTQYLYFETHQYADIGIGFGDNPIEFKNINFLTLKPEYFNSDGVYSFAHATTHRNKILWVNQYWVDLDVFDLNNSKIKFLVYKVKEVLQLLNNQL